jgi:hypothetical protein
MTPDDIEKLIRDRRPEPSPALRARILAAAAQVERSIPWWKQLRTWSAAALILLAIDIAVQFPDHHAKEPITFAAPSEEKLEDLPFALPALASVFDNSPKIDPSITLFHLRKEYLP